MTTRFVSYAHIASSTRFRASSFVIRREVGAGWMRWGAHESRHAWPYATDLDGETAVLEPLRQAVLDDPGISAVGAVDVSPDSSVATLIAFPTTAPQNDEMIVTVKRLRSDVFPLVLEGSQVSAHVGDRVADRLPAFIAAMIVLSFLLLTAVFRSVMVPLKAALLNLLSIGAAYGVLVMVFQWGVLVMVFQWGWGKGLIGLESTVRLGLATASFVDATVVRIVLVPATMKLMGDRNCWMPAWLDRLVPTADIEGESSLPAPELETMVIEIQTDERDLVGVS